MPAHLGVRAVHLRGVQGIGDAAAMGCCDGGWVVKRRAACVLLSTLAPADVRRAMSQPQSANRDGDGRRSAALREGR